MSARNRYRSTLTSTAGSTSGYGGSSVYTGLGSSSITGLGSSGLGSSGLGSSSITGLGSTSVSSLGVATSSYGLSTSISIPTSSYTSISSSSYLNGLTTSVTPSRYAAAGLGSSSVTGLSKPSYSASSDILGSTAIASATAGVGSSSSYTSPRRRAYGGAKTDSNLADMLTKVTSVTDAVAMLTTTTTPAPSSAISPSRTIRPYRGTKSSADLERFNSTTTSSIGAATNGLFSGDNFNVSALSSTGVANFGALLEIWSHFEGLGSAVTTSSSIGAGLNAISGGTSSWRSTAKPEYRSSTINGLEGKKVMAAAAAAVAANEKTTESDYENYVAAPLRSRSATRNNIDMESAKLIQSQRASTEYEPQSRDRDLSLSRHSSSHNDHYGKYNGDRRRDDQGSIGVSQLPSQLYEPFGGGAMSPTHSHHTTAPHSVSGETGRDYRSRTRDRDLSSPVRDLYLPATPSLRKFDNNLSSPIRFTPTGEAPPDPPQRPSLSRANSTSRHNQHNTNHHPQHHREDYHNTHSHREDYQRRRHYSTQNPNMVRSNSFRDLRDFDNIDRPRSVMQQRSTRDRRDRHQTLTYGISASDLREMANHGNNGNNNENDYPDTPGADWRMTNQVPMVGTRQHDFHKSASRRASLSAGVAGVACGFESDMSGHPNGGTTGGPRSYRLPRSLSIARLERESGAGKAERGGESEVISLQNQDDPDEMIVLSTADLNKLLSAKPTVLIGRDLASLGSDVKSGGQSASATISAAAAAGSAGAAAGTAHHHHNPSAGGGSSSAAGSRSQNGSSDVDYKKLWEESQKENGKLRDEMSKIKDDLSHSRRQLDLAKNANGGGGGGALTDSERREKRALEKKLSEMEEELKLLALSENLTDQQLEHLKNDNQRLRDENGALIRVISKLSK